MELQQLRTFLTVAREGTLVRAAKSLALSQPAISAQLKALEEELRVRLFDRGARGVTLTADGQHLLGEAERAVAAADAVVESARRVRGEPEGLVRLGSLPDPATLRLGEILARVQEDFPRVRIELHHGSSREIRRGILEGTYEAGFVLGPSEPSLERLDLRPVRLVVAVPAVADEQNLTWEDVCHLPWIGSPEGCPFQLLAAELFARMRRAPRLGHHADFESAIVEMIDADLGASLLREDSAAEARAAGRCAIVPGIAVDTTLAFLVREARPRASAVAAVQQVVRDFWSHSRP